MQQVTLFGSLFSPANIFQCEISFFIRLKHKHSFLVEATYLVETLYARQVPKLLGEVRSHWCPSAMCISFKLETDQAILIKKAKDSISKYVFFQGRQGGGLVRDVICD